jgi:hypothetical protein
MIKESQENVQSLVENINRAEEEVTKNNLNNFKLG